jgi:hypothetical protein
MEVDLSLEWNPEAHIVATVSSGEEVTYRWFLDGVERPELTDESVEKAFLDYGQSWSVEVTPVSGGRPARAKLELAAAPSLTPVLTPAEPTTVDNLDAFIVESEGFLQDPVFSVRWWVNDVERPEYEGMLQIPEAATTKGERWTVGLQAIDPWSAELRLATVVIGDAAPELPPFVLTPVSITTLSTVTARVAPSDADGDVLDIQYHWSVDGQVVQEGPWHWLKGDTFFDRDQEVSVEVVVSDGEKSVTGGAAIVVGNSLPGAATVALDPPQPVEDGPLSCLVVADAIDPDEDALTYTFAWSRDGVPFTDVAADGSVPAGVVDTGDTWTCTVTASDDVGVGGSSVATGTAGFRYDLIAVGGAHLCALQSEGDVLCQGDDTFGQSAAPAGLAGALALAAGVDHTCALDAAGAPVCWGSNASGQLDAPTGPFVSLTAGAWHTCALDAAGAATCWGLDAGQLQAPADAAFTTLSAGAFHTCGVTVEGAVRCWGTDALGLLDAPAGDGWIDVASGDWHTCAIDAGGATTCWGWGDMGQASAPADLFLGIGASDEQTCAIAADESLVCWGARRGGMTPPTGTYRAIDGGAGYACALTTSGGIRCWGDGQVPLPVMP